MVFVCCIFSFCVVSDDSRKYDTIFYDPNKCVHNALNIYCDVCVVEDHDDDEDDDVQSKCIRKRVWMDGRLLTFILSPTPQDIYGSQVGYRHD